jgi:hypothetical protein
MPQIAGAFPYNVDNLLGGAVRALWAPIDTPIPADISDVIDMTSPYAPVDPWEDFGATKDAFSYSRGFETSGYEIQQSAAAVLEEVTSITRTLTVSVAELTPTMLQMLEETGAPGSVAAGTGTSAQDVIKFGSFQSTTPRRIVFVSRRNKASGVVKEGAGADDVQRGAFVMGVGYNCQVTADSIEMAQAKGELTAFGLQFRLFPDSSQVVGEEYGAWFLEHTGTIS